MLLPFYSLHFCMSASIYALKFVGDLPSVPHSPVACADENTMRNVGENPPNTKSFLTK